MAKTSTKAQVKSKPAKNNYLAYGLILVAVVIAVVAWFAYFGTPKKSVPSFSPNSITYITTSVTSNGSGAPSVTTSPSVLPPISAGPSKDKEDATPTDSNTYSYQCMSGSFVPRLTGSNCVSADHVDKFNAFMYTFDDLDASRYYEVLEDAGFTLYKTSQDDSGGVSVTKYFFAKQTDGSDGLCGILVCIGKSSISNVIAVSNITNINKFDFVIKESNDGKTDLDIS